MMLYKMLSSCVKLVLVCGAVRVKSCTKFSRAGSLGLRVSADPHANLKKHAKTTKNTPTRARSRNAHFVYSTPLLHDPGMCFTHEMSLSVF